MRKSVTLRLYCGLCARTCVCVCVSGLYLPEESVYAQVHNLHLRCSTQKKKEYSHRQTANDNRGIQKYANKNPRLHNIASPNEIYFDFQIGFGSHSGYGKTRQKKFCEAFSRLDEFQIKCDPVSQRGFTKKNQQKGGEWTSERTNERESD